MASRAIVYERQPQPGKRSHAYVALTGAPGRVRVKVQWRRLPDKQWTDIASADATVKPPTIAKAEFDLAPPREGTYVIRALLTRAGRPAGALERLLDLGKPSDRYVMEPEAKRLGDGKERYATSIAFPGDAGKGKKPGKKLALRDAPPDVSYELGVWSPHMAWARPYYLGKTRAFLATQAQVARDVIEVAQRMDLDFRTVTMGIGGWKLPGDLVRGWNRAAA